MQMIIALFAVMMQSARAPALDAVKLTCGIEAAGNHAHIQSRRGSQFPPALTVESLSVPDQDSLLAIHRLVSIACVCLTSNE